MGAIHLDRGFEAARRFIEWALDDAASMGAAHIDGNYKVCGLTAEHGSLSAVHHVDCLRICQCVRERVCLVPAGGSFSHPLAGAHTNEIRVIQC